MDPKKVIEPIAITGPTASGKTAAAIALARRAPVEIISVDSALVYRSMDIGTAKPTPNERAAVPHHLIDIRDPHESYNAAAFVKDVMRQVVEIQARGHWPVLVGGTMLYLKALVHGLDEMPSVDPMLRQHIAQRAADVGWPALHAELMQLDPLTAARLAPMDAQRISRALEMVMGTGQTLSSLQRKRPTTPSLLKENRIISLEPAQRTWLHQRIAERFDSMLEQGFWPEMLSLYQDPRLTSDWPSMRCVGYRQAWQLLDEVTAANPTVSCQDPSILAQIRDRWIETACAATRQLAKRQLTWLRAMPQRHVIACDQPDSKDQVVQKAMAFYDGESIPT